MPENGDWREYKRMVLTALDRLEEAVNALRTTVAEEAAVEKLRGAIEEVRRDVAVLQTKAAFWGAIGGILAGSAATVIVRMLVK